ncbi:MAG: DotU family type IV/VI secretion system protein [Janthinobacterium lividum]
MTEPLTQVKKTTNLASCFQEVLTAVLRIRSQRQQVQNNDTFRAQLRQLLQTAMNDARALGYNAQYIQMAVLVTVGFMDETVLNLGTPAGAEWARRPLQEELFGGHVAGETVFANLQQLLQQQDAPELADVLEIHCLCLELGYKGKFAFSNGAELRQIIQMCREKMLRIRGQRPLFPAAAAAPITLTLRKDSLALGLLVMAVVLAVVTLLAFAVYTFSLSSGSSRLSSSSAAMHERIS